MTDEGRRPLAETIALILTGVIGLCLIAGVVGVIVVRVVEPDSDLGAPASSLGTLLSVLGGYVIGAYRSKPPNGTR